MKDSSPRNSGARNHSFSNFSTGNKPQTTGSSAAHNQPSASGVVTISISNQEHRMIKTTTTTVALSKDWSVVGTSIAGMCTNMGKNVYFVKGAVTVIQQIMQCWPVQS